MKYIVALISLSIAFSASAEADSPTSLNSILPENVQVQKVAPVKKRMKAMPGVGKYAFIEQNTIPPVVVTAGNGSKVIAISSRFMNRISTPFRAPRIIDTSNVTVSQDDSSIFILPNSKDPFVIYITGTEPGDAVISFTVLPKDIPAQTIVLQSDLSSSVKQQRVESYSQKIVELMRKVATGSVPAGFSEGKLPTSAVMGDEIQIIPRTRYSGSWVDIYKYSVVNNSKNHVEISETSFYKKGVRAVSIYPNVNLQPGEMTEVFVIADKSILEASNVQ